LAKPLDCGPLNRNHRKYLTGRGFDPDQIADMWGVEGCGGRGGAWRHRIIIPIYEADGSRWVSWTARTTSQTVRPRYKVLEADKSLVDVTGLLYGQHLVPGDTIVVVEGPLDAWAIGPGAVALLGAGWDSQQLMKILVGFSRVSVLFDEDLAGRKHRFSLCHELAALGKEVDLIHGMDGDPASLSKSEIATLRSGVGL